MALNTGGNTSPGTYGPYFNAGAPSAGTNAVQTLSITGTPTGGTFTLSFAGETTAAIAYNATAAAVATALVALGVVGASGFAGSGGDLPGTPAVLTAGGNLGHKLIPVITVDGSGLTGGSSPAASIANTTPGVTATARGALPGALLIDTTNKTLNQNTGTALAPVWSVVTSAAVTVPQTAIGQIATADAATQTGSYVQADVQTIATLANANKAKLNTLLTELHTAGILS
jgi:hypothetical protein